MDISTAFCNDYYPPGYKDAQPSTSASSPAPENTDPNSLLLQAISLAPGEVQLEEKPKDKDVDQEEDEYEVEKILKTKMVHWKGYDETYDTWEPEENLEGAKLLVKAFMKELKKKRAEASKKAAKTKKNKNAIEKLLKGYKTPDRSRSKEPEEKDWSTDEDEHGNKTRRPKRHCVKGVNYESPPSPTAYYRSFVDQSTDGKPSSTSNGKISNDKNVSPNELLLQSINNVASSDTPASKNSKKSKRTSNGRSDEAEKNTFDVWRHLLIFHKTETNITELTQLREFNRNQLSNLIDMSKKNPFVFLGGKDGYMLFGGFLYKRHKQSDGEAGKESEWKCISSPDVGCNAMVHSQGDQAISFALHNHPADFEGMEDAVWKYYGRDIASANASTSSAIAAESKESKEPKIEPNATPTTSKPIEPVPATSNVPSQAPMASQAPAKTQQPPLNVIRPKVEPQTPVKDSTVPESPPAVSSTLDRIEQMIEQAIPQVQGSTMSKGPTEQQPRKPMPPQGHPGMPQRMPMQPNMGQQRMGPPGAQMTRQMTPQMRPPMQQPMMGQPRNPMQHGGQQMPQMHPPGMVPLPPASMAQQVQQRPPMQPNIAQKRLMEANPADQQPAKRPYPGPPQNQQQHPMQMPPHSMPQYPNMASSPQGVMVSTPNGPQMMHPMHHQYPQHQNMNQYGQTMTPMSSGQMQMTPYGPQMHPGHGGFRPGMAHLPQHFPNQPYPGYQGPMPPHMAQMQMQNAMQQQQIPRHLLQDPQLTGFRVQLLDQIRCAIMKIEADGYVYRCFANCNRFSYKGFVYHLPTGRTWFCAKRTRRGEICTAMLTTSKDPSRPTHHIIAQHDHPMDYGFLLREICRQLLYNSIADKCDPQIFDKIYHVLKALFPELLTGNVLPDFDSTRHRVWNSPMRDVDVERVKLHYRKMYARNQVNNPIIKIDGEDDQEVVNSIRNAYNVDDSKLPPLPISILPIYENIEELEEPDRRPFTLDEIMGMINRHLPHQPHSLHGMVPPRPMMHPGQQNMIERPGMSSTSQAGPQRPIMSQNQTMQRPGMHPIQQQTRHMTPQGQQQVQRPGMPQNPIAQRPGVLVNHPRPMGPQNPAMQRPGMTMQRPGMPGNQPPRPGAPQQPQGSIVRQILQQPQLTRPGMPHAQPGQRPMQPQQSQPPSRPMMNQTRQQLMAPPMSRPSGTRPGQHSMSGMRSTTPQQAQGARPMMPGQVLVQAQGARPQTRPPQSGQVRPGQPVPVRPPIQQVRPPQVGQNTPIRPATTQPAQNQTPTSSTTQKAPENQSSVITLLAYVSDPLFFCVNGVTKLAYRGDIYQLNYETPEFTFWHCDRKSCKARLKQVTSNNQFMFFHLCDHQTHMPPVYKINDVPVIRLNVLNPKIETPTFKHFSVPGMTIKKEHIMADVPESILKTATVNVPNRVKPTQNGEGSSSVVSSNATAVGSQGAQTNTTGQGNTRQVATNQPSIQKTSPVPKPSTTVLPVSVQAPQKPQDPNRWKELAKFIQTQYSQILKESNEKPYLYVNGKDRRVTYRGHIFVTNATNTAMPLDKSLWMCVNGPSGAPGATGCQVLITFANGKIQFVRDVNHNHPMSGPALRLELLTFLVVRAATNDQTWTSSDARNVLGQLNQSHVPTETRIGKWIAEQRARGRGFYDHLGFIKATLQSGMSTLSNIRPGMPQIPTQPRPQIAAPPRPPIPNSIRPQAMAGQQPRPQTSNQKSVQPPNGPEIHAIVGQKPIQRVPASTQIRPQVPMVEITIQKSPQQVAQQRTNIAMNAPITTIPTSTTKKPSKTVDPEEERWKVTIDFPLLFPTSKDEKDLPRMGYQGHVYYKVSAIDEFSLWKCELSKNRSQTQPSCRATIEVSRGKVQLIARHNHPENYKNMWTKLKDSGIDIGVYGVPKSEPKGDNPRRSKGKKSPTRPTSSREPIVLEEDSDSDDIQVLTPAATPVAGSQENEAEIVEESVNEIEALDETVNEDRIVIEETVEFMIEKVDEDEKTEGLLTHEVVSIVTDRVAEQELEERLRMMKNLVVLEQEIATSILTDDRYFEENNQEHEGECPDDQVYEEEVEGSNFAPFAQDGEIEEEENSYIDAQTFGHYDMVEHPRNEVDALASDNFDEDNVEQQGIELDASTLDGYAENDVEMATSNGIENPEDHNEQYFYENVYPAQQDVPDNEFMEQETAFEDQLDRNTENVDEVHQDSALENELNLQENVDELQASMEVQETVENLEQAQDQVLELQFDSIESFEKIEKMALKQESDE